MSRTLSAGKLGMRRAVRPRLSRAAQRLMNRAPPSRVGTYFNTRGISTIGVITTERSGLHVGGPLLNHLNRLKRLAGIKAESGCLWRRSLEDGTASRQNSGRAVWVKTARREVTFNRLCAPDYNNVFYCSGCVEKGVDVIRRVTTCCMRGRGHS